MPVKNNVYLYILIMAGVTYLIRTLPQLQCDPHRPNDTAAEPHELTHAPDALRYFVAGRPFAPPVPYCAATTSVITLP